MRLKREENHNELVSKKGLEPLRLKARAPKTLVAAISPLRDKLAYALSMMRLTKQVTRSPPPHWSLIGRKFTINDYCGDRVDLAVHISHETFRLVHLTATRSRPACGTKSVKLLPFPRVHFCSAIGGGIPINTSRL